MSLPSDKNKLDYILNSKHELGSILNPDNNIPREISNMPNFSASNNDITLKKIILAQLTVENIKSMLEAGGMTEESKQILTTELSSRTK